MSTTMPPSHWRDLTVVVNDNSKNGARVVRMVNGDDMSFSAENVTFETPV